MGRSSQLSECVSGFLHSPTATNPLTHSLMRSPVRMFEFLQRTLTLFNTVNESLQTRLNSLQVMYVCVYLHVMCACVCISVHVETTHAMDGMLCWKTP